MSQTLLNIEDLSVEIRVGSEWLKALDQVSLKIEAGESLALVGESGSGKSLLAQTLLGLHPTDRFRLKSSRFQLLGEELGQAQESTWRKHRGKNVGMVMQEPLTALHPIYSIGSQLAEALTLHGLRSKKQIKIRCLELLERVGLPDAERRLNARPGELSGGMRQRVLIAMALLTKPKLLILDEPTTALDVTVQAQIIALLQEIRREEKLAYLFITHDLALASQISEKIAVLYAGRLAEIGPSQAILSNPQHPYTQGLLSCRLPFRKLAKGERLSTIDGRVPDLRNRDQGCSFRNRCPKMHPEICSATPPLFGEESHRIYCHQPELEQAIELRPRSGPPEALLS